MSDGKNSFEKTDLYKNCLLMTQQFRFCGNPFRADTYQGCTFGCKYCFATQRNYYGNKSNKSADINVFKRFKEGKGKGVEKELISNNVPIHLGGMSDPFQHREFKEKRTLEFLKIFNDYPVSISTKTSHLTDDYWQILNPEFHTFQISLISDNEETIRKFEKNTPTAKERISFIKELKKRGFWVSVRIQPIVDVKEAISLLSKLYGYIDYATVEHLKIPINGGDEIINEMFSKIHDPENYHIWRNYFKPKIQVIKNNIDIIKSHTNIKIGCGDNEIHQLSGSLNCCGLDCMPDSFKNWIKYNSMYILMTDDKSQWYPKTKLTQSNIPPNTMNKYNGLTDFKVYVDKYMEEVFKYGVTSLF